MPVSKTAGLELFSNRLALHSALNQEEQKAILTLPGHVLEMQPRQDFLPIGDETSWVTIIVSGLVGRYGQVSNGQRQIAAFYLPGDAPDLHTFVRHVSVGGLMALSKATVLRIGHAAIREVTVRHPAVAEAFWRDCVADAAVMMQNLVSVGRRSARARLAHLFCEMAVRIGADRDAPLRYDFPAIQEHLADATGMTTVHVNRSLKSLEHDGLMTFDRGKVHIYEWDQLARLGGFDPAYLLDARAELAGGR